MKMQHMRYKQGLIEVARLEEMYKAGKNFLHPIGSEHLTITDLSMIA